MTKIYRIISALSNYKVTTHSLKIRKKKTLLPQGQGKGNHFEICPELYFPSQDLPLKETILPEPHLLEFYQILTDLRKRGLPKSSSSSLQCETRKHLT